VSTHAPGAGPWIDAGGGWDLGTGVPQGRQPILPSRVQAQVIACACCASIATRIRTSSPDRTTVTLECAACLYTWREVGLIYERVLIARVQP